MSNNPEKPTHDLTTHHLLEFKHPGAAILALAEEISKPHNNDLKLNAQKQPNFELCLGQIGADLGVVFDGTYDVDYIAGILLKHMKQRSQLIMLAPSGSFN